MDCIGSDQIGAYLLTKRDIMFDCLESNRAHTQTQTHLPVPIFHTVRRKTNEKNGIEWNETIRNDTNSILSKPNDIEFTEVVLAPCENAQYLTFIFTETTGRSDPTVRNGLRASMHHQLSPPTSSLP
mmetsp:Transcript_2235/g.4529  ORF Transcript_2235/g.4529 Transcript_2235/m.4529 type:complete len:127 (+) Transcript_2235:592-972(+)